MNNYLNELMKSTNFPDKVIVINSDNIVPVQYQMIYNIFSELMNLIVFPVEHTYLSYGISLIFRNNFKFSYTGDLSNSPQYIAYIQDSDICVHESTFSNEMNDVALDGKHCTINDALMNCEKANVKMCILTHFSPRYVNNEDSKEDWLMNYLSNTSEILNMKFTIAFDGFEYNMKDPFPFSDLLFPELSHFLNWKKEKSKIV